MDSRCNHHEPAEVLPVCPGYAPVETENERGEIGDKDNAHVESDQGNVAAYQNYNPAGPADRSRPVVTVEHRQPVCPLWSWHLVSGGGRSLRRGPAPLMHRGTYIPYCSSRRIVFRGYAPTSRRAGRRAGVRLGRKPVPDAVRPR